MKWINALQLQQWAATLGARTAFPELIGDLIRSSEPTLQRFDFPPGTRGRLRFHGWLEADACPLMSQMDSLSGKWSLTRTTFRRPRVTSIIAPRTPIGRDVRPESVFVSCYTFHLGFTSKPLAEWLDERRALRDWNDVRIIDGVQLENWLERAPAVAAKYARNELKLVFLLRLGVPLSTGWNTRIASIRPSQKRCFSAIDSLKQKSSFSNFQDKAVP